MNKTRLDRMKMSEIRDRVGLKAIITDVVKKRRLTWFGHVVRRGQESIVLQSYKKEFMGKRPRGRPPKRWMDQIRHDVELPLLTAERIAKNRIKWKECVTKKCAKIL